MAKVEVCRKVGGINASIYFSFSPVSAALGQGKGPLLAVKLNQSPRDGGWLFENAFDSSTPKHMGTTTAFGSFVERTPQSFLASLGTVDTVRGDSHEFAWAVLARPWAQQGHQIGLCSLAQIFGD